jgi:hypothetical protein
VAGQMVVIGLTVPPAGFPPESEVIRASMLDTNVNPPVFIAQPKVWIPIVVGIAGGGIAGGIMATNGGGSSPTIPPPATCGGGRQKCGR